MRKTRLLHVTSTRYGIGGVEKLLLDMSTRYNTDEFEVMYCNLFCDSGGLGVFPSMLREAGLRVIDVPGRTWGDVPGMVTRLARVLRNEHVDIVHLHMRRATIFGGMSAMLRRSVKTVVTKHYDDRSTVHQPLLRKLDIGLTKSAERIIAISEHVKEDMISLSVSPEKISVIHNGIDLQLFDDQALRPVQLELKRPDRGMIIGTVGSLTPRKGHGTLLDSVPQVLRQVPTAHFVIVGEGPEQAALEARCISLGIENNVTFLGFQPNVAAILKRFDVYVHPSKSEPFGIAVIEAMASAKCVIATAVGGVSEIVRDGETGILVAPDDPDTMARSLIDALGDPGRLTILGIAGRRRVEEDFDIAATVRKYEDIYRGLVPRFNV